jgi:hypothetical protein
MSINSDREFYLMVGDKAKAYWARVGAGEDFDIEANKRFYSVMAEHRLAGKADALLNTSLMAHQRLILSVMLKAYNKICLSTVYVHNDSV